VREQVPVAIPAEPARVAVQLWMPSDTLTLPDGVLDARLLVTCAVISTGRPTIDCKPLVLILVTVGAYKKE
jgi:hypothetical protein